MNRHDMRQAERLQRLRVKRRRLRDLAHDCIADGAPPWRVAMVCEAARKFAEALGRQFVPLAEAEPVKLAGDCAREG